MLSRLLSRILDWLAEVNYPAKCYRCGSSPASFNTNLCSACYADLIDTERDGRCSDDGW
jgi:hypothetical protein